MFDFNAPEIDRTMKFGSRDVFDVVTCCAECGDEINTLYSSRYTDKYGNVFCNEECAMQHYGIRLVEV